jgi:N-methylhydantoinase B
LEDVQNDVKNGYVTVAQAEKDYGVVLNPDTLEIERLVGGRVE